MVHFCTIGESMHESGDLSLTVRINIQYISETMNCCRSCKTGLQNLAIVDYYAPRQGDNETTRDKIWEKLYNILNKKQSGSKLQCI